MQILIVSLLFLGIIMVMMGLSEIREQKLIEMNRKSKKNPRLNIRDDNMDDGILQQQFSTNKQDSEIESQFKGETVSEIFGDTFSQGALFSHGFVLGTDLKAQYENNNWKK